MALKEDEFRALIEQRLRAKGVSPIRAARSAGLSRDAIRAVLRGRSPSFERAAEICRALNLDFHIGPAPSGDARTPGGAPPETQTSEDTEPPAVPLTRFSSRRELPVRDWERCSPAGHLSQAGDGGSAPAPLDLPDSHAFYARARGHAMVPAGIWPGDYCLISPCAKLEVHQRAWFRQQDGRETLKWLIRLPSTGYELVSWEPPDEDGLQRMVAEQWMRADVVDRGVVLAVYRGRPSVERPPFRAPDWRADQVADP